ncbi:hypothetical protein D9619_007698 [Psilocybe cf. subviscida]|uniref:Uncharacterized protein n=1 Tax=Psilocybe cf. subviscida TaxID=2480587 RepID=A0A8H5ATF1_9AGAR|nr:hypothetical protein D9619_007698 [Psilocybe cf. subviscida]
MRDRETRFALAPHLSEENSVRSWLAKALHDQLALRTTVSALVFKTLEDAQQVVRVSYMNQTSAMYHGV